MKGVALGVILSRREIVQTDASLTGWGAVWQHRTIRGNWNCDQTSRNINVLELKAVQLALEHFGLALLNHHVLIRTDNTSVVYHITSGRHNVQSLAEVDMGPSDMGFPSIGKHQSDVCTGSFECGGRFLVLSQTFTGRVETQSGSSSDDLASIWQSKCGSHKMVIILSFSAQ